VDLYRKKKKHFETGKIEKTKIDIEAIVKIENVSYGNS